MITIRGFEVTTDPENALGTTVTTSDACGLSATEVTIPPHANGSKNSTHSNAPTKKRKLGTICEKEAFSGAESTKKYTIKNRTKNNSQKKQQYRDYQTKRTRTAVLSQHVNISGLSELTAL